MVKYIYDAWGNHKDVDNNGNEITDTAHIGNINPYRYRGYYFDTETGLYYLKSRYYDPQTGRFISLDDISFADPDTINGLNLYAYCCNNPVMRVDPNGNEALSIFAGVLAIAGTFLLAIGLISSSSNSLGNSFVGAFNAIGGFFDDVRESVNDFISSLTIKNQYDSKEKHHIVAKKDPRAFFSRVVLMLSDIGIDSEINLAETNKTYHKVLHTNGYYILLNLNIGTAYVIGGKKGVALTLGVYKGILEAL